MKVTDCPTESFSFAESLAAGHGDAAAVAGKKRGEGEREEEETQDETLGRGCVAPLGRHGSSLNRTR